MDVWHWVSSVACTKVGVHLPQDVTRLLAILMRLSEQCEQMLNWIGSTVHFIFYRLLGALMRGIKDGKPQLNGAMQTFTLRVHPELRNETLPGVSTFDDFGQYTVNEHTAAAVHDALGIRIGDPSLPALPVDIILGADAFAQIIAPAPESSYDQSTSCSGESGLIVHKLAAPNISLLATRFGMTMQGHQNGTNEAGLLCYHYRHDCINLRPTNPASASSSLVRSAV